MEHKSLWKNFLLLTVGGLLALHVNVSNAADNSGSTSSSSDQEKSEGCVLTE